MIDQFLFAMKLSDDPQCDPMLDELATCVLKQIGYAPAAIADTLAKLRAALREDADPGHRNRDVQFRAEGGQLIIVISNAGGRESRIARALPD